LQVLTKEAPVRNLRLTRQELDEARRASSQIWRGLSSEHFADCQSAIQQFSKLRYFLSLILDYAQAIYSDLLGFTRIYSDLLGFTRMRSDPGSRIFDPGLVIVDRPACISADCRRYRAGCRGGLNYLKLPEIGVIGLKFRGDSVKILIRMSKSTFQIPKPTANSLPPEAPAIHPALHSFSGGGQSVLQLAPP
jgi:hypothetical protein